MNPGYITMNGDPVTSYETKDGAITNLEVDLTKEPYTFSEKDVVNIFDREIVESDQIVVTILPLFREAFPVHSFVYIQT